MWRGLLAALVAVPLRVAEAQETAPAGLEAELAAVRASVDARKWSKAGELLRATISDHEQDDELVFNWAEIEELLLLTSFWTSHHEPTPAQVVGGDLISWDEKSGAIKLRYHASDRGLGFAWRVTHDEQGEPRIERAEGDFIVMDDVYLHPMIFKGAYSIEIEALPGKRNVPTLLLGWDGEAGSKVGFYGNGAVVSEFDGVLQQGLPTYADSRRPMRFGARLSGASVSAFYEGKLVDKGQRSNKDPGQLGFSGFGDIEEVTISGEIEPSWIAGLLDEEVQGTLAEFRKQFDPFAGLSADLRARVSGTAKSVEIGAACPTADAEDRAAWDEAHARLESSGLEAVIEYAGSLPTERAVVKDWLRALSLSWAGRLDEARAACERTCAALPGFLEAQLLRARLIGTLGSKDDEIRALEALVVEFPEFVDPVEALAEAQLARGRFDEARRVVEVAIENGMPPAALTSIERVRLRALHGPRFGESEEFATEHYRVVSDMGRKACFEIATELEKFYRKYEIHLRRVSGGEKRKFPVYVFSGLTGYENYCEDLSGEKPESELGRYVPSLKQLLIWNSPEKRMMMRTVRHEGFHQYLDQLTSEAPAWLHEGMAEYYEQAQLEDGKWEDGVVNEQHVAVLLQAKAWTPLREFVYGSHAAFRSDVGLHYPQAWAFVHFLVHGDRDTQRVFDALLDALGGGAGRVEALDRAFGAVDWKTLELGFRRHVAALGR